MRLTAKDRVGDQALFLRPNGDKNEAWAAPFIKQSEVHAVLDKLAAYEDTGLEPEEFKESVGFVLELNKKLKPYMDAEEHGRLVMLPCKVGDTFFFLSETIHGELYVAQSRVSNIVMAGDALMIVDTDGCYHCTYWFTREEAEAALKGGRADASNT